ncbi:cytochrome C [Echinicola strongylocentroti]|uniref:Cytochrome C n=1 Tax=Echinicola strongylocentroti TaxID=1795355 RepID=A0A2Z4IKX0_9BACT|nr:c-type cytochrome [Echinicola strongylocentroti]AWW31360.1 cytochrome C [Echinicola strongylocentroti]
MNLSKLASAGVMALAGMAYACGGGSDTKTEEAVSTTETEAPKKEMSFDEMYKDNPDYVDGLALVKESDCPSCHMVERKIVGPAYKDVAEKYESTDENIETLAKRVVEGNNGVWGQVPMPAHPGLSEDDAKKMVKYVLMLKK